jgi:hypothetical protein
VKPFSDPLPFPQPAWLAAHTEANIEAMLELLSTPRVDCMSSTSPRRSARCARAGCLPAWRALDRANLEMLRRNTQRQAR